MADAQNPSREQQRLAAELRALRGQAGVSTYQLARMLGWSQAKVSKMERAQSPADADDVCAWATATGASAARVDELAALAAKVTDQIRQWREVFGVGLAARQREVAAIHAAMTGLREFASYVVPGFLQTPAYAAKVLELADVPGRGGVSEAVTARMARQAALLDPRHSFRFVLTETALKAQFGSPGVMREQSDKILAATSLPNVSLRVLPARAPAVALQSSGFVIYDLPDGPLVLIELLSRELQLRTNWDVRVYEEAFARLEEAAIAGDDAKALVQAM